MGVAAHGEPGRYLSLGEVDRGRGRAPAPGAQPGAERDQAEACGEDEQVDEAV